MGEDDDMEGEEVDARLLELNAALQALRLQWQQLEAKRKEVRQAEVFLLGQIQEREMDKPDITILPVHDDEVDLNKALLNRGKDIRGNPEAFLKAERQDLAESDAKGVVDAIDEVQKEE